MQFRLESVTPVSPSTRSFRFRCTSGAVPFKRGQFYRFVFEDSAGLFERSYSLANYGAPDDVADLLISEVEGGRATRVLWSAESGLTVAATGPFGKLTVPEPAPERLVLVATSVGLAPFLPILEAVEPGVAAWTIQLALVLGIRKPDEFICRELIERLAALPGFEVHVCYSRDLPAVPGPTDHAGYVQAVLPVLALDGGRDVIMVCGNPPMVQACRALLSEMRFPRKRVRHEPYVFAPRIEVQDTALTDSQKRLIAEKVAQHQRD